MDGSRKHHFEWGNPAQKDNYHMWFFKHKAKKTNLQFTTPENLDNNEDTKRDIHDLIYMESRKGQDLLSKLGACGPWEMAEGEGRGKEESREKCIAK